ncbi:SGNH hydrolase-type esterase domain-containing protein [Tricladium varicosporioides]|nr:SGNH hydrolase-type esterase domain-containing protein [Hymenoscyphus varicosporioides]
MAEHSFDAYINSDTSLIPQPTQATPSDDALDSKNTIKILCFGDSLTEGYTQWGSIMAPYSTKMKSSLMDGWGIGKDIGGWEVGVETRGVSGEGVREMRGRMQRACSSPSNTAQPPHLTIFLGGTNDLGRGRRPIDIFNDIIDVISTPLSKGSRILLLTIPECAAKNAGLNFRRNELNKMLKHYAQEMSKDVYVFDLYEKIKYHDMSEEDRNEYWDDGLHLTAAGYKMMGEMVAKRVMEFVCFKENMVHFKGKEESMCEAAEEVKGQHAKEATNEGGVSDGKSGE